MHGANRSGRDDEEVGYEQLASTAPRRFHAARQHPHRGMALSARVAGCELQFQAPHPFGADARAGQVRRLLHGRPSGRAQHAGASAQAQRDRHFVRPADSTARARGADGAPRADRDRVDDLQRAVSRRAEIRVARPYQRRTRRMERGDLGQPGRGAEFRPRGARRACDPLPSRARVLRRRDRPVG